jgi:glycosyltransferase involved in cell wall biosynthesis
MHVLHVIDGLGLGGAERMLVDIANRTVADGHRASVCVTRSDVTRAHELDRRVELLVLNRKKSVAIRETARLVSWIRMHRVDVIHSHMRSSTAYLALLRAMRVISVPIVFHDHYGTIELDDSVPLWFRIGRRYIHHYVGVYERLSVWAREAGMPASRVSTIPNGVDFARFAGAPTISLRDVLGSEPIRPVGILVATIRREKGIELLLDALAKARHRDAAHILVVGHAADASYFAECTRRTEELGLGSHVTFLGSRSDVPSLLRSVDFALLTSHTESGPLVLLEYVVAGLPFVATLVGDIGRRIESHGIPAFVPPGDAGAFARALDELVGLSREERAQRGERGRRVVTDQWDIRHAMPNWYEIYASAKP